MGKNLGKNASENYSQKRFMLKKSGTHTVKTTSKKQFKKRQEQ